MNPTLYQLSYPAVVGQRASAFLGRRAPSACSPDHAAMKVQTSDPPTSLGAERFGLLWTTGRIPVASLRDVTRCTALAACAQRFAGWVAACGVARPASTCACRSEVFSRQASLTFAYPGSSAGSSSFYSRRPVLLRGFASRFGTDRGFAHRGSSGHLAAGLSSYWVRSLTDGRALPYLSPRATLPSLRSGSSPGWRTPHPPKRWRPRRRTPTMGTRNAMRGRRRRGHGSAPWLRRPSCRPASVQPRDQDPLVTCRGQRARLRALSGDTHDGGGTRPDRRPQKWV